MVNRDQVSAWMAQLKSAWEGQDVDSALQLFRHTEEYYERPFKPGKTQEEYRTYWQDIVNISDIKFSYEVLTVEGNTACVHWENWFRDPASGEQTHLDGVFGINFHDDGTCRTFRQWWFME